MSGEVALYYFEGRGRAEVVRMALAAAGIEFKDNYLKTREQFTKMIDEGLLLFNQVPLLQIDGFNLVQSKAIVNYVAQKGGLVGKTPADKTRAELLAEGAVDFIRPFLLLGFENEKDILKDMENNTIPKYLPVFEKVLQDSRNGYLVGDGMTVADLYLLQALLAVVDYFTESCFDKYPAVKAYYNARIREERISHYITNIRHRCNDERYIKEVKTVLNW